MEDKDHQSRVTMTKEPKFDDKFVAFVDILGFESKVESAEQLGEIGLSDILEICRKLENQAHVRAIATYGPMICPESRYIDRNLNYQATQISDCAVVSAEVSPAGIINLLQHIAQAILGLLRFGVMVRGYVTRGSIFHEDKQFIGVGYQNAFAREKLVSAFRMSENDGATPFVEIDPNVESYIRDETDECVQMLFARMTKRDAESRVTVLFPFQHITSVAGGNIAAPQRCRRDLNVVRQWIGIFREKIQNYSPSSNQDANRKSKYYINILDELLEECDRIENALELLGRPAVRLMLDQDFNVVPTD